jgi:hypothetical protein
VLTLGVLTSSAREKIVPFTKPGGTNFRALLQIENAIK